MGCIAVAVLDVHDVVPLPSVAYRLLHEHDELRLGFDGVSQHRAGIAQRDLSGGDGQVTVAISQRDGLPVGCELALVRDYAHHHVGCARGQEVHRGDVHSMRSMPLALSVLCVRQNQLQIRAVGPVETDCIDKEVVHLHGIRGGDTAPRDGVGELSDAFQRHRKRHGLRRRQGVVIAIVGDERGESDPFGVTPLGNRIGITTIPSSGIRKSQGKRRCATIQLI